MPSVDNQKPTARQCPSAEPRVSILLADVPESVFGKWFAGSTGDPPVPSGDSPDGTGATVRANRHGVFATLPAQFRSAGRRPERAGRPRHPFSKQALSPKSRNTASGALPLTANHESDAPIRVTIANAKLTDDGERTKDNRIGTRD